MKLESILPNMAHGKKARHPKGLQYEERPAKRVKGPESNGRLMPHTLQVPAWQYAAEGLQSSYAPPLSPGGSTFPADARQWNPENSTNRSKDFKASAPAFTSGYDVEARVSLCLPYAPPVCYMRFLLHQLPVFMSAVRWRPGHAFVCCMHPLSYRVSAFMSDYEMEARV